MDTQVISTICSNILPQIHLQVHKLTVEEHSMKQMLYAANYPQLYSLSLVNFHEITLHRYLTDDLILRDLLTKQITHLNIDIIKPVELCSEIVSNMFALILSLCKKLIALNFCDMFPTRQFQSLIFHVILEIFISSTLMKLKINVVSLIDCLYILDGPFVCLSTLIINIGQIFHICLRIDPTVIGRLNSTYIDGIQLYDQFLIYMTQLKKFTFNIKSEVYDMNVEVELQSNEDIQRSFIGRGYQKVASYVNTNVCSRYSECHIYSLPYDFEFYVYPQNSFQRGMFHKVRKLKMSDGIPFEHKLFKFIAQEFPFFKFLYICNDNRQDDKQDSSTLITFPYLTFLDLEKAHVDYAELFLLEKNMHLPCLVVKTKTERSTVISVLQWTLLRHVTQSLDQINDEDTKKNILWKEMYWLNQYWAQPVPKSSIAPKYSQRLFITKSLNTRRDLYEYLWDEEARRERLRFRMKKRKEKFAAT
ncbi:unnamed protein product, partial [Rotaria sp. Silwood1]